MTVSFDWGEELPVLGTPRLRLRPPRTNDIAAIYEIFRDPEVMRYWNHSAIESIEDATELLEEMLVGFKTRALFEWAVARVQDDLMIGTCTLFRLEPDHRRAEVGFALGRSHWRQGYMSEALAALLGFAFQELKLHRVEADVDPRNDASIRCL